MTTRTSPAADSTAPMASNGLVGSGAMGSTTPRLNNTIAAMTMAWKMNAARQLIAVVMRPPISGPAAAPIPPIPVITPNARARAVTSVSRMVVRMYTGGMSNDVPTPSRIELPMISTPRLGAAALNSAPIA